jgi:hypothetical protein
VIDAVRASPLVELFRPGNLVKPTSGQNRPKATKEGLNTNSSDSSLQRVEQQFFSPPPPHPVV